MKRNTIISIVALAIFALTGIVWVKWGGFSNDMGTFILLVWLAFVGIVLLDHIEKSPKKVKE